MLSLRVRFIIWPMWTYFKHSVQKTRIFKANSGLILQFKWFDVNLCWNWTCINILVFAFRFFHLSAYKCCEFSELVQVFVFASSIQFGINSNLKKCRCSSFADTDNLCWEMFSDILYESYKCPIPHDKISQEYRDKYLLSFTLVGSDGFELGCLECGIFCQCGIKC